MVTSQSARDLGIPYPSQEIRCSLEVSAPDGSKEIVETNKFLTQSGYGRPVQRVTQGPRVQAPRAMRKMVARFDSPTGLQDGELTGHIVAAAFWVDVVARQVPVQIKALNERARAMSKAKTQASTRQLPPSKAASASGSAESFLFTKRPDKSPTRETPPPKQSKQDQSRH